MAFVEVAASTLDDAYEISNSLRLNDGDGPKLQITTGSTGDRRQFTFSCWFKLAQNTGDDQTLFSCNDGGHLGHIRINSAMSLNVQISASGSDVVTTNRLFRDYSAWNHLVVAQDTEQGTAANRLKIYVNGVLETSFSAAAYTDQNTDTSWNSNTELCLGRDVNGDDNPFDGYIAEAFWIDGTQYAASDFGKFNDNGVWVPIDAKPNITFGTHGFYFEFKQTGTSQNSSGIGAVTSGQDNHYAVTNLAAADITIDTPTNNFCILNSLHKSTSNVVLSEGNLKAVLDQSTGWQHAAGTIAVQNGKWYWEAKALSVAATDKTSIGVFQFDTTDVDFVNVTNTDRSSKGLSGHGAGTGSYAYAQGEIVMCGMDLDNNKVYWGKDGTWFGSLDPAAGSGSTTQTISNANFCVPAVGGYGTSSWELNFGVPQFSISSGNADANGYGNFEFAVPSGFYALCTKNLAEYG